MKIEDWNNHICQWLLFLNLQLRHYEEEATKIKTFRQMKALENVRYSAVLNPGLILEFISPTKTKEILQKNEIEYILDLNQIQKEAVKNALSTDDLFLIQGPPGTGKTQVITEICLQLYKEDPEIKILLCSETHVAVNNLLERIASHTSGLNMIRVRNNEKNTLVEQFEIETRLSNYYRDLKSAGVDEYLIEKYRHIFGDINNRKSIAKSLILSSSITGITCNGIGAYNFDVVDRPFDYVIIDEVCKATLPEILMPLSIANKAILVGDPKQLPPVFCIEDVNIINSIKECKLQEYKYIDSLFLRIDESRKVVLNKQYRMANDIGDLVSELFYKQEKLKNGLDRSIDKCLKWANYQPTKKWPVENEDNNRYAKIYNNDEIEVIEQILDELNKDYKKENISIAIISPYRPQIRAIRNKINKIKYQFAKIEINTVDAFQGREADVVIFSITRTKGTMRFFSDPRRLNVAISRAKDYLFIVGDKYYAKKSILLNSILQKSEIIEYKITNKYGSYFDEDINQPIIVSLDQINILDDFKDTIPSPEKLEEKKMFYDNHGRFEKPIMLQNINEKYYLVDGYITFLAAESIGCKEIEGIIKDVYV
ncbi:MAG: DEAD/DEAH box helicase [Bacteroidales bacterium]